MRSGGGSGALRILEGLTLPTITTTTGRLRMGPKLLGLLLLISTIGCGHEWYSHQEGLAHRILLPADLDLQAELPAPKKLPPDTSGGSPARLGQPKEAAEPDKELKLPTPAQATGANCEPAQTLTLAEAIDTAFRLQPRLRVYLEGV